MTPPPEEPDWTQLEERGSGWLYRRLVSLHRFVGPRVVKPLLYPLVTYFFLTGGRRRRALMSYFEHLASTPRGHRALEGSPSWWDVYRLYLQFGHVVFDRVSLWLGLREMYDITFHDRERFLRYRDARQGVILLSFHVGSFGLMRYAAHAKDVGINVLAYWRNTPIVNRLIETINPSSRLNVIQTDPSSPEFMLDLKERVEDGEFVAVLGDRVIPGSEGRVSRVPFLGEPAAFPQGPYIMAHLLECPILLVYCVRTGKRKYEIFAEPFADTVRLPRKERDRRLDHYVRQYVRRLEDVCHRYPYQWFNFHDFWDGST